MKKVLIITQYFYPDVTAAAYRMKELYEYLNKKNCEVCVVTTSPHKTRGNWEYKKDASIRRIKIGSKRHFFQYAEFLFKASFYCIRAKKFDRVIVTSPPFTVFLLVYLLPRKTKVILDIRDIWPDSAIGRPFIHEGGPLFTLLKKYERSMYKRADRMTCVSAPMKSYLVGASGKENVAVVYNGVREDDVEKFKRLEERRWDKKSPLKLFYFGNIGYYQGIDILLKAVKREVADRVEVHIIGGGVLKGKYKEEYGSLKSVHFHNPMPREALLPYVRANSDALFINIAKSAVFERTIPSKLFDYLLLRKPTVSGILGEGKEILRKSGCVVEFKQDCVTSLVNGLYTLIKQYDFLAAQAAEKNLAVVSRFTREIMSEKIYNIIDDRDLAGHEPL